MPMRFWCILMSLCFVIAFLGCAEKQVKTVEMDKQADAEKQSVTEKKAAADQVKPAAEAEKLAASRTAPEGAATGDEKAAAKKAEGGDTYVVKKGDSLWKIACLKNIYGDAYLWPLLYNANKKMIKNPNRIYPGQKLTIPRDGVSTDAIKKARKKAGAKKPYAPPANANPPTS